MDWLTLPLVKAERDVRIQELRFPVDARERLEFSMRRFPLLAQALKDRHPLIQRVLSMGEDVTEYLCGLVEHTVLQLGIAKPILRSSMLGIAPALKGQDRVLAIVKALGGTRYVNPSGGRELYDHPTFIAAGVELRFLTPYAGGTSSILSRLLTESETAIAAEIRGETMLAA